MRVLRVCLRASVNGLTDSNARIAFTRLAHTAGGSARTTSGRGKTTRSCAARKHRKILKEKRSDSTADRSVFWGVSATSFWINLQWAGRFE
jgi:hypothetical protein